MFLNQIGIYFLLERNVYQPAIIDTKLKKVAPLLKDHPCNKLTLPFLCTSELRVAVGGIFCHNFNFLIKTV